MRQAPPQFFVDVVSAYQNKKISYIGHLLPRFRSESPAGAEIAWRVHKTNKKGVLDSMA
jgi:hypothetical protein